GHDIGMTGKGQQGTGLPTYRPEIVHITKAQTLSPEANGFQAADHHLLTASILGSDRGATDKINSELQGRGQRGHNAASCRDLPGIKAAILPALAGWLDKEWRWGRRQAQGKPNGRRQLPSPRQIPAAFNAGPVKQPCLSRSGV